VLQARPMSLIAQRHARAAIRSAAGFLMRLSGRNFPYRLGRFLMNEARFDAPNDPTCNGERQVQATVLQYARADNPVVVFDIGANVGDWTNAILQQAKNSTVLQVHAFEPCSGTHEILARRVAAPAAAPFVKTVPKACSSRPGTAKLHVVAVGAGTNTLTSSEQPGNTEEVQVTTVDEYCRKTRIDHVAPVKIDAEGHDLEVIRGATRML
jgi:FkbM family methyltransferase